MYDQIAKTATDAAVSRAIRSIKASGASPGKNFIVQSSTFDFL